MSSLVLVLIVVVVWCFRVLNDAGGFSFLANGDLYTYFCPMIEVAFSEMRAGRLFLWNPYQLNGLPGLATLQVGLFYPPHLLYLVFSAPTGLGLMTFVHLLAIILLTAVAARVLRFSWPAAAVSGSCFALSGYVLACIVSPPALELLAWLPLGVAAVDRVTSSKDRRWLPVLCAAVAMPILAGGYQGSVYILYTYLIYGLIASAGLWWRERSLQEALARGCLLAVAAIAGLMLAAPQLLPTIELAQQSARSTSRLPLSQVFPFGQMVTPVQFLTSAVVPPERFVPGYVGAVPLLLAAGALCVRRSRVVVFSLVLVGWGVLGTLAPLWFVNAQAMLPALGWFRIPSRVFVLANFGIALLAGLGFDALRGKLPRSSYLLMILIGSTGVLTAVVRYPHASWWLALATLPIAGAASLVRYKVTSVLACGVLLLLLLLDLVGVPRNTLMLPYVNGSWRQVRAHSGMLQSVSRVAGWSRTMLVGSSIDWPSKAAMLDKFYSPSDYEPLAMKRFGDFYEYAAFGRTWPNDRRIPFAGGVPEEILKKSTSRSRRFLRLLSVRFFLMHRFALLDPGMLQFADELQRVSIPQWEDDPDARNFVLLEDPDALPRAYGVYEAECLPTLEQQLARLADPGFDPHGRVILDGDCHLAGSPGDRPSTVSISSYTPTAVELVADMSNSGFVVLTDSDYPGWEAFVNGRREPILRANALVRAVRVPAGRNRVEFRYIPWTFYIGTGLAATPIALGFLLAIRKRMT